jgi:hypothetical protein
MRIVAPFVARFKDGHTFVETDFESDDFVKYCNGGGRFFPLGIRIIEGRLYASRTDMESGGIQSGDEILSINGVKASKVLEFAKQLWSADGEENAIATMQRLFSYTLWAGYGWGNDTKVAYMQNGQQKLALLRGIEKNDFLKLTFNVGGKLYELHLHPEHRLAVLEINSYGNLMKSKAFIDSSFRVIREMGIRHVALDLRKNGGGNSAVGTYFLSYLTRKPYHTIRHKSWHVSPLMLRLPSNHYFRRSVETAKASYTQNGNFLISPASQPEVVNELTDSSLYYPANIYLFTSPTTYSSAHMTAMSVKCGGLGTIIGRPTGERLDLTGEIVQYRLPHTNMAVFIPLASYKSACGDGRQVGVQPDYPVKTTIEDVRNGKDPELEFLKQLIRK